MAVADKTKTDTHKIALKGKLNISRVGQEIDLLFRRLSKDSRRVL